MHRLLLILPLVVAAISANPAKADPSKIYNYTKPYDDYANSYRQALRDQQQQAMQRRTECRLRALETSQRTGNPPAICY